MEVSRGPALAWSKGTGAPLSRKVRRASSCVASVGRYARGMDGRGEPRNQPIGMLATIARLIDERLADTREQYATLLEARPKPWVLDDALVARSRRVNSEALDWCGVYDPQLTRWVGQRLTPSQRREVIRLQGVQRDQRRVLNEILALLQELAANTIDRQLAKSDVELGLEYLLGFGPPLPPRRPGS